MGLIEKLLQPQDILLGVDVADQAGLFQRVGEHLEHAYGLSGEWAAISLTHRERIGSTALGEGIAIPHARLKGLDCIQILYVRPHTPIPFQAPDGKPVAHFLILLVPKQATEEHLEILAEATQALSLPQLRVRLQASSDPLEIKRLLAFHDTRH
jgi:PTS system nitrogen regulatory IIA component